MQFIKNIQFIAEECLKYDTVKWQKKIKNILGKRKLKTLISLQSS